jgi:hypothetical protein
MRRNNTLFDVTPAPLQPRPHAQLSHTAGMVLVRADARLPHCGEPRAPRLAAFW